MNLRKGWKVLWRKPKQPWPSPRTTWQSTTIREGHQLWITNLEICRVYLDASNIHTTRPSLSEDTSTHRSLQWNMSTLTVRTHPASPTLHTSLHINGKFHFPQIVLSVSLSVPTLKHRWKRTPSYLASKSVSCHCCMYYHCVASLFYFPLFLQYITYVGLSLAEDLSYSFRTSC